jgi:hypothetical protein
MKVKEVLNRFFHVCAINVTMNLYRIFFWHTLPCFHPCRVDQFWCHGGIFSIMGLIASVISYYICWVWLIRTHFQIIDFNIYMVQFLLIPKDADF